MRGIKKKIMILKKILLLLLLSINIFPEEYLVIINASSYTNWVYYSFDTHSTIEIDDPENSLEWDIAFQRKHIKTNSGLSGIGSGGAVVDSVGTLDAGAFTWVDNWEDLNEIPEYGNGINWLEDTVHTDFYDIISHTYVNGVKNPALNAWGWFNETFVLDVTNYVMFVKSADGEEIVKFWAYDYYANGSSGNIALRYQTGLNICSNDLGDLNGDSTFNILDVIFLVNIILLNETVNQECSADINQDGILNILDIILLVSFILEN